jgi:stage 0 sporulation protein B (sporulation initiation phosphotransferase)
MENGSSGRDSLLEMRSLMAESLSVLRTYRHDLMNQVQLLRAYTQMKKFDRLQGPIDAMVKEAERHTEWSSFPSPILSYTVLSRDIHYPMLRLHVTYEQAEVPSIEAEMLAGRMLSDLLDTLGEVSRTVLEPIPVDVWIVSFRQGYEIGWFVPAGRTPAVDALDWETFGKSWRERGGKLTMSPAEDGVEYSMRLSVEG